MARKQRPDSERAFVSNYPELDEWLRKNNAYCQWQLPLGGSLSDPAQYIESWQVGRTQIVILVRERRMGWELFSACPSNRVDETLADADARVLAFDTAALSAREGR